VTVILMQRSEGGGLGVSSGSGSLMTARGAADFLTRATAVLATIFVLLSIAMAALATVERAPGAIDPAVAARRTAPISAPTPAQGVPMAADPLARSAQGATANAAATPPATAPAQPANSSVPLAH
jgi:preprotein translocase subunit SecG